LSAIYSIKLTVINGGVMSTKEIIFNLLLLLAGVFLLAVGISTFRSLDDNCINNLEILQDE